MLGRSSDANSNFKVKSEQKTGVPKVVGTRDDLDAIARRDIVDANRALVGDLFGVVMLLRVVWGGCKTSHGVEEVGFYRNGPESEGDRGRSDAEGRPEGNAHSFLFFF